MRQDMAVDLSRMRIDLCCTSVWESSASTSLGSLLCVRRAEKIDRWGSRQGRLSQGGVYKMLECSSLHYLRPSRCTGMSGNCVLFNLCRRIY